MLKNFGKDRKVRENFFENGEGTNKLVTSGSASVDYRQ